jgi:hypothetical protein
LAARFLLCFIHVLIHILIHVLTPNHGAHLQRGRQAGGFDGRTDRCSALFRGAFRAKGRGTNEVGAAIPAGDAKRVRLEQVIVSFLGINSIWKILDTETVA